VLIPSAAPIYVTQHGGHIPSFHENVASSGNVSSLQIDDEVQSDIDQPIALRKGKRSCTLYPCIIFYHMLISLHFFMLCLLC